MTITFTDPITAAKFVAQLVREGVTFKGRQNGDEFEITLTGGF